MRYLKRKNTLLIIGIIFIAFNLRPAITSVGPLISSIRTDLSISNGLAGLLTTLPLLAFAVLSSLAPKIAVRFGLMRTLFLGLLVLIIGIVIRSNGLIFSLFLGTVLIGLGIALCNVLLPGLVKQKFPDRVGLMTSLYSTSMGIFAALGSGLSIPFAKGLQLGWQKALLFWALLTLLAIVIWIPQVRKKGTDISTRSVDPSTSPLWKSSIAWQVTLFMGLQSFLFYSSIAWLTEILYSQGLSLATAGWMLSFMQMISLPATFLTPVLAERFSNQRGIVLCIGILYFTGISGLLILTNMTGIVTCVLLIGLAQGASISLSLTLLSLRARTSKQASELSGMAQSFGYLLAATGPFLIGLLYDVMHSWTIPLLILLGVIILLTFMGWGAGRNQYVLTPLNEKN